jgi:hypothetical protein
VAVVDDSNAAQVVWKLPNLQTEVASCFCALPLSARFLRRETRSLSPAAWRFPVIRCCLTAASNVPFSRKNLKKIEG